MDWLNNLAAALSAQPSDPHPPCEHGHDGHDFEWVHVNLADQHLAVPDYPPIAADLEFDIRAGSTSFDDLGPGYCPASGEVSRSLLAQGAWEGYETALAVQLLTGTDGAVIDIGSNLGWYSLIAARLGHPVLAIEADWTLLAQHISAVARNGVEDLLAPCRAWIGYNTPMIDPTGAPGVRLLKADIEGAEPEALRVFLPLFAELLIDYAVVELTPQWSGPNLGIALQLVRDCGYQLFAIPDKGHDPLAYAADPLACTLAQPRPGPIDLAAEQSMGLLVRPGLTPHLTPA